jgi:FlaA1/EpsC-like NDP-sugar epimerase
MQKLNQFKNKSILITGGTGSFGKQFVKRFILKKKIQKNNNFFKR